MPRDPLPSEAPFANPLEQPVPGPVLAGRGCQFITAGTPAAEAGKCGLPVVWRSPYCYRHHRRCLRPPMPFGFLLRLVGLPEADPSQASSPGANSPGAGLPGDWA